MTTQKRHVYRWQISKAPKIRLTRSCHEQTWSRDLALIQKVLLIKKREQDVDDSQREDL